MSSALPEPEPKFTAHLRAVKPGEPADSSCPSPHPAAEPAPIGTGFVIGWIIFRLTVWATVAVWIHPPLLDLIGGDNIARWLLDHGWFRLLSVPPLGLLALISAFELLNGPRRTPRARIWRAAWARPWWN